MHVPERHVLILSACRGSERQNQCESLPECLSRDQHRIEGPEPVLTVFLQLADARGKKRLSQDNFMETLERDRPPKVWESNQAEAVDFHERHKSLELRRTD